LISFQWRGSFAAILAKARNWWVFVLFAQIRGRRLFFTYDFEDLGARGARITYDFEELEGSIPYDFEDLR